MNIILRTGVIGVSKDILDASDEIEMDFIYSQEEDEVFISLDGVIVAKADWSANLKLLFERCLKLFADGGEQE